MHLPNISTRSSIGGWIRHFLLAWLSAVTIEYLLLPQASRSFATISGISQMSIIRVVVITVTLSILLHFLSRHDAFRQLGPWGITGVFSVLTASTLISDFSWQLLGASLVVLVILCTYSLHGWNSSPLPSHEHQQSPRRFLWITAGLSLIIFLILCIWTVCRYLIYGSSTYDFGIFCQMFDSMKNTGLPTTTLERDGALSHFRVHMSPIYYLMLPFYCLAPSPVTLQILQAAVVTSSVIPLWKLGGHHGLSGLQRCLLCATLLLFPAFSGGVSYDLHENCFLTPLILWLFYGLDRKSIPITAITSALTLLVKEDAAVYVAVIGLWMLLSALLHRKRWDAIVGGILLVGSVLYFVTITGYLAQHGDGVMTFRYDNLMLPQQDSLIFVVLNILRSPMKALYECADPGNIPYIVKTMLPLSCLPLLTRRYERYLLLIPYILINLLSDYPVQHSILFQYCFGSLAFLVYLTLINLADLPSPTKRTQTLSLTTVLCGVCFLVMILPKAITYPQNYVSSYRLYQQTDAALDTIPDDASVCASGYYTAHLSDRTILYDLNHCSIEHLLSSEYVAIKSNAGELDRYGGKEGLTKLLQENGYTLYTSA